MPIQFLQIEFFLNKYFSLTIYITVSKILWKKFIIINSYFNKVIRSQKVFLFSSSYFNL